MYFVTRLRARLRDWALVRVIIWTLPDMTLTIQEVTRGVETFLYMTCGRENKSCVMWSVTAAKTCFLSNTIENLVFD